MKNLKDRLKAQEAVHGCWLNSGSEINAEIVGNAGFDWVLIDLEHGIGTENNLVLELQALSGCETISIVRVEALDFYGSNKSSHIIFFILSVLVDT
ncbi:MAG: aldolase/citrate lyase family protein, partial [Bacteroidetes bacterium]|nr:aldolase/citrate lyase family protein [Bacteroidota bacterium]MDA1121622.1 aldolase/citrate lyase family protein [Bacteroidota bacterium]